MQVLMTTKEWQTWSFEKTMGKEGKKNNASETRATGKKETDV